MSITSAIRTDAATAETSAAASITNSLALGLHGAVVAAASRCHEWIGRGDTVAADAAAVDAMRTTLPAVTMWTSAYMYVGCPCNRCGVTTRYFRGTRVAIVVAFCSKSSYEFNSCFRRLPGT